MFGEVLYGKWKIRLLWFINEGHQRPSELQRKIPDASRRVLNIQLNELEKHNLISRKIYPVVPPKVEYSLTEFGKTLIPVIAALGQWANEHEYHLRDVILKHIKILEAHSSIHCRCHRISTVLEKAIKKKAKIYHPWPSIIVSFFTFLLRWASFRYTQRPTE